MGDTVENRNVPIETSATSLLDHTAAYSSPVHSCDVYVYVYVCVKGLVSDFVICEHEH